MSDYRVRLFQEQISYRRGTPLSRGGQPTTRGCSRGAPAQDLRERGCWASSATGGAKVVAVPVLNGPHHDYRAA
ncbi:MAG TPA: hypothetical protein VF395_12215 [Polyangiaceae bacterium]